MKVTESAKGASEQKCLFLYQVCSFTGWLQGAVSLSDHPVLVPKQLISLTLITREKGCKAAVKAGVFLA